ncbi:MAG: response regulator transcription factor [Bacteroidia bacterium]|nr:response regulator transcription factor [Bacteroidia bacterium]
MILKALIIDDQQHFIDMLIDTCKVAKLPVTVVATALNAHDGFIAIRNQKPDLVFLDVEMPGKTGLEMINEIKEKDFEIIVTTSHDKYALQAIKTQAIDYLLKPVDLIELSKAVDSVLSRKREKLMHTTVQHTDYKKLTVSTSDGMLFIEIGKLVRLEADNVYTTIYCIDGSKVIASKPLKDFDERLQSYGFVRVHKSHLINMNCIKKFYRGENAYLVMSDEGIVPVSKTGRDTLQQFTGIV